MRSAVVVTAVATLGAAGATGCTRDAEEAVCPDVAPGELVITELRGPQRPEDSLGPWIEIYNASGRELDLAGTRVRFRRKDGSSEVSVLVRRAVPAPAGSYTVLGLFPDEQRPGHVDYGMASDFHERFLAAAAVDVETCGERIDRMTYDALPTTGTYSLGGAPDAEANDLPASWCNDALAGAGSPGTPQQPNVACP
ncbi:MAG: hypothetical protein ACTHU0_38420 [Kofleriaceae bacterium]